MYVDTVTIADLDVEIHRDPNPQAADPRVTELNVGTMVIFDNDRELGDRDHGYSRPDSTGVDVWSPLKDRIILDHDPRVILPLYMANRTSGVWLTTKVHGDPWDTDLVQVGYIFDTSQGRERLNISHVPHIRHLLEAEVDEYGGWLRGEVYRVVEPSSGRNYSGLIGRQTAIDAAHDLAREILRDSEFTLVVWDSYGRTIFRRAATRSNATETALAAAREIGRYGSSEVTGANVVAGDVLLGIGEVVQIADRGLISSDGTRGFILVEIRPSWDAERTQYTCLVAEDVYTVTSRSD